MSENYITTSGDNGSISISEEVVAVMVTAAIAEADGVAGLSNTVGTELAELIGKKGVTKGIKVQFLEDEITVDALITVRFGHNVTDVAKTVQQAVANSVESMTGIKTITNIHVSGIAFDK